MNLKGLEKIFAYTIRKGKLEEADGGIASTRESRSMSFIALAIILLFSFLFVGKISYFSKTEEKIKTDSNTVSEIWVNKPNCQETKKDKHADDAIDAVGEGKTKEIAFADGVKNAANQVRLKVEVDTEVMNYILDKDRVRIMSSAVFNKVEITQILPPTNEDENWHLTIRAFPTK